MNLTKYPLINGFIIGLMVIMINQYAFSMIFVTEAKIGLLSLYTLILIFVVPVISIILATRSVVKTRAVFEDRINFITALNSAFITFLIALLLVLFHLFIYGNFINPDLGENVKTSLIEVLKAQPGDKIEIKNQIDALRSQELSFSLSVIVSNLLFFSIISFVISLIIAVVIKKDLNKLPE